MLRSTWLSAAKWTTSDTPCASPGRLHRRGVADVAADEGDAVRVSGQQVFEVGEVPGVGELVERDDLHRLEAIDEHPHEVGSNKPGCAGVREGYAWLAR